MSADWKQPQLQRKRSDYRSGGYPRAPLSFAKTVNESLYTLTEIAPEFTCDIREQLQGKQSEQLV